MGNLADRFKQMFEKQGEGRARGRREQEPEQATEASPGHLPLPRTMTGPEAHLHTVLETQGLARSLFKPGEASFIIPNAVSRERIIQAWSAEDAVLSDVSIDGSSLKSMGVPWVAFTTHRAAAGIDSKSWKERLARGQIRYAEVKGVRWEATGGSDWTMAIEGSMTTLRVVFRGALDEAMHQALEGLILQAETRAA